MGQRYHKDINKFGPQKSPSSIYKIMAEQKQFYISMNECKDKHVYRLDSRNITLGVFLEESNSFTGLRTKFSETYLFVEFHYDVGPPIGTVKPIELIEKCPIEEVENSPKELFNYLKELNVKYNR